jgi:hypothetical protein
MASLSGLGKRLDGDQGLGIASKPSGSATPSRRARRRVAGSDPVDVRSDVSLEQTLVHSGTEEAIINFGPSMLAPGDRVIAP